MSGLKCQSSGPIAAMQVKTSHSLLAKNYLLVLARICASLQESLNLSIQHREYSRFRFINYCFLSSGVCSLNNKLYVVGGSDPCGQKGLKNCDVFDPVSKAWTSCAPLNISKSC